MYFFDYIFYRTSRIYIKTGIETRSPEIFASGVVTLFQCFNIFALLYLLFSVKTVPYSWVYIGLPLLILNWIFLFNRKNLKKYQKRWDGEKKRERQIKGILIIIYLIISIYLFGLALNKMY